MMSSILQQAIAAFRRKSSSQAVVVALLFALAAACPVASDAQTFRYSSVVVEGNKRISDESVMRFAGLNESGVATAADLSAAFQGIAASGLFEDVAIQPGGNRILITVTELPIINAINIERNTRFTDEILIQAVSSRPAARLQCVPGGKRRGLDRRSLQGGGSIRRDSYAENHSSPRQQGRSRF